MITFDKYYDCYCGEQKIVLSIQNKLKIGDCDVTNIESFFY